MGVAEMDKNIADGMTDERSPGGVDIGGSMTDGVGDVTGETANQGIRLPRLQIAYGVGNLAKNFSPGDLVLGGDNLLAHKQEPIDVIIWKAVTFWREYLGNDEYNAGLRPRNFATEAEAIAAGGITKWPPYGTEGPKPTFSEAMDLSLLIRKPKDLVCGLFGIEIEGSEYGVAIWTIDKGAFKRVAPTVKSNRQFSLRKRGLISGIFSLSTSIETVKGRVGPVPNLKLLGHNTDAFVLAVCNILGAPAPEALQELAAAQAQKQLT